MLPSVLILLLIFSSGSLAHNITFCFGLVFSNVGFYD